MATYTHKLAQLEISLEQAQVLLVADALTTSYAAIVDMRVTVKTLTEQLREYCITDRDAETKLAPILDDADAMFEALVRRADGFGGELLLAADAAGHRHYQAQDATLTPCPACQGTELFIDDSVDLPVHSPRYAALGVRVVVCGNCGHLRLHARDGAVRTMARALGMRRLDLAARE